MEHPPNSSPPRLPWNVKLLGIASLLNDMASEMIAPLLPEFLTTVLKASKWQLGLIEGVAETVSSLTKLWSGGKSDQAGQRKLFVVWGYAVPAIARPLIGLAGSWWHVFALKVIDRFGKGVRTSPRDAIIAESSDETIRGRAFGFHRAMDHTGAAVGALLAFGFLWLFPEQLRILFLLALLPAIPILILLPLGLAETRQKPAGQPERLTFSLTPFDWNFRRYLIALLVFTLGNASDSFLLVRAKEVGVPVYALPLLWIAFHFVKGFGNEMAGKWSDRLGPRPLIWAGWLLYAAVYLAFAFASAPWQIWVLFLFYGAYFALTEPSEKALVASIVGKEHRGLAYGWYNLTIGIGALPASLMFGVIYEAIGPVASFGTGAALSLLAAVMLATVRVGEVKRSEQTSE